MEKELKRWRIGGCRNAGGVTGVKNGSDDSDVRKWIQDVREEGWTPLGVSIIFVGM